MEAPFAPHQKEYLAGLVAGAASRGAIPFAGPSGASAEPEEPRVHGVPLSELTREELLKYEMNPLDAWDRIVACANDDRPPDGGDVFRFKFHGLFWVAPAQDAFMVRVRVPGNALRADQLRALAQIATTYGAGNADLTTRGNVQLRGFRPRDTIAVLLALFDCGLTSRGAGADNVRNITASPTAGLDPEELIDLRPQARALQHHLLNHRELFGLPRKFNVAFDGGSRASIVADTNDLGFVAARDRVRGDLALRILAGGVTGHGFFANDLGIACAPHEGVAVAAAALAIFAEYGDRTDRKRARLAHLLERRGAAWFCDELRSRLAFALSAGGDEHFIPRLPIDPYAHLGVHAAVRSGEHYVGFSVTAGRLTVAQMRGLAEMTERFGSGELRTTVWQSVLVPDVPKTSVPALLDAARALGFDADPASARAGIIACTGNAGCRFSATDTKSLAVALGEHLAATVPLESPLKIHITGCPNSCAQHAIGDVGLLGIPLAAGGVSVEGYHVFVGGCSDGERGLGRELVRAVAASEVSAVVERIARAYLSGRQSDESFTAFARRHDIDALRALVEAG